MGKGSLSNLPRLLNCLGGMQKNDIMTQDIDDVVIRCSSQLVSKVPVWDEWPPSMRDGTLRVRRGVDRFCGSGITSVNLAAANIMSGMDDHALRVAWK